MRCIDMTTTELIKILSDAEQSVSEIDYEKYLYKIFNDRLMLEMSDEITRKLTDSNTYLKRLGLKIIPVLTKDMNMQGFQVDLEVENKNMPFATISFDKDELQKIVDKKVQEYEINAEQIRAKAIDEFYDEVLNFEDYIEPIDTFENGAILLYSGKDITDMIVKIKEQITGQLKGE